jgi:hypothetical protein
LGSFTKEEFHYKTMETKFGSEMSKSNNSKIF